MTGAGIVIVNCGRTASTKLQKKPCPALNLEVLAFVRTIKAKRPGYYSPLKRTKKKYGLKSLAGKFAPFVTKPDKKGKLMPSPEK